MVQSQQLKGLYIHRPCQISILLREITIKEVKVSCRKLLGLSAGAFPELFAGKLQAFGSE